MTIEIDVKVAAPALLTPRLQKTLGVHCLTFKYAVALKAIDVIAVLVNGSLQDADERNSDREMLPCLTERLYVLLAVQSSIHDQMQCAVVQFVELIE